MAFKIEDQQNPGDIYCEGMEVGATNGQNEALKFQQMIQKILNY